MYQNPKKGNTSKNYPTENTGTHKLVCFEDYSSDSASMFLDNLHDVFVHKNVIFTDSLRTMFDRRSLKTLLKRVMKKNMFYPDESVFERLHQRPMDFCHEALDCINVSSQNDRFCVVRKLSLESR